MTPDEQFEKLALDTENGINNDVLDTDVSTNTEIINSAPNIPVDGSGRIDKNIMPDCGSGYPEHMQFDIRPASTREIKHWSTIDDNAAPTQIYGYFTDIIEKCVTVHGGTTLDIKEHDRLWFVLYIHEISFIEAEKPAVLNAKCKNPICKHAFNAKIGKNVIQFDLPTIDKKYVNTSTGAYDVLTKSYGTITIARPSIKVGNAIMQYINDNDAKWVQDNTAFLDMVTYLVQPHLTATKSVFDTLYADYRSWSPQKTSFMIDLIKKCKLTPKQQFIIRCPKCSTETSQDFDLEGGIRSLLLPVSDIDNELI